MLDSNSNEYNQNLTIQKLFEHQILHRFDSPGIEQNPSIGSLILWLHGFNVVNIVGIDPREA
jgi:hypothetical protein